MLHRERGRQHCGSKQNHTEHVTKWGCKICRTNHGKGDMCTAKIVWSAENAGKGSLCCS